MSDAEVETIAQKIEHLGREDKWTLLSLLVESLRHEAKPSRPALMDYLGVGKGRGFQSAAQVDAYIQEERASWEGSSGEPAVAST